MTDDKTRNRRAETAKRNDDSGLVPDTDTPGQQGRSGGDLQTDVATQASKQRVRDPEATEGVSKADKQQYQGRDAENAR